MSLAVAVVGGGTFGRALALQAARCKHRVTLWSRSGRALAHERIEATTEIAAVTPADLVFVAVPSSHVVEIADLLCDHVDGSHVMVHVSRGLVGDDLTTVSEVLRARTPCRRVGALGGPLVASALADGQPGGGIVGSLFPEVAELTLEAIAGPSLRLYHTQDVVGVEVASAFVGLVALAVGHAQAMKLGPGTLAVLATRGLAEATRVGERLGADERTFAGLAGAGDVMAAIAGDGRPEVEFGRALAEGLPLATAAERAGAHVEGSAIARRIAQWAARGKLQVPITAGLARLLAGEATSGKLMRELMSRPLGTE